MGTNFYKLYYCPNEEVCTPEVCPDLVTFDGVPDQSYSRSSGISTDTTISKKIIYWFGATVENLTISGKYISYEQKDLIDNIIDYIKENETYAFFEDGIYRYKILNISFDVKDIIGDTESSYEYTLSMIVLSKEILGD